MSFFEAKWTRDGSCRNVVNRTVFALSPFSLSFPFAIEAIVDSVDLVLVGEDDVHGVDELAGRGLPLFGLSRTNLKHDLTHWGLLLGALVQDWFQTSVRDAVESDFEDETLNKLVRVVGAEGRLVRGHDVGMFLTDVVRGVIPGQQCLEFSAARTDGGRKDDRNRRILIARSLDQVGEAVGGVVDATKEHVGSLAGLLFKSHPIDGGVREAKVGKIFLLETSFKFAPVIRVFFVSGLLGMSERVMPPDIRLTPKVGSNSLDQGSVGT